MKSVIIFCFTCLLLLPAYTQDPTIRKTVLPDKVEHWQKVGTQKQKPWFWQQIENLANVIFGNTAKLPFSTSTALLVEVSEYKHLRPQLSFVEKDLKMMREYLLGMGGFDEVYVMKDKVVTPRLIKEYMQNKFRKLDKNSRLLFYYSGHGADYEGGTGYMQFYEAKKEDSVNHVLEIDICEKWSKMLKVKHILFIFDCCVSGLAFTPKGDEDMRLKLADTLGGNGSRIVITAGTGDEKSFGVDGRSVFTQSLLSALENKSYFNDGLLTVDQAFGELQSKVAWFSTRYDRKMTPRIWTIGLDYTGTFIFTDPGIREKDFAEANEQTLPIIPKGDIEVETIRHKGNLAVVVQTGGQLYLGDALLKTVPAASTTTLKELVTGDYTVMMHYDDGYEEVHDVTVAKDTTVQVEFSYVPGKQIKVDDEKKIPDWMVFVEGGTFMMGTRYNDEKPVHEVTVDSFYMSKYEVTQEEYLKFCNSTKTHFPEWLETGNMLNIHTRTNRSYKPYVGTGKEKHPIVGISWYDAAAYCNWLSKQEGLKPCYSGSGDNIVCNFSANGYRLPTEAEWEYAARGGKKSKGYEYSGSNDVKEVAWYADNSGSKTHPVAQKKSNELGLYDMSGNVWEWCWDWYGGYPAGSVENPRSRDDGRSRVLRGGCWIFYAWYLRSAFRYGDVPGYRGRDIGFRLARGR